MASRPDPRRSRWLLAAWLGGAFAVSAVSDPRALGAAGLLALLLFRRGSWRTLRRTALSIVPVAVGLSLASLAFLRIADATWPRLEPFGALVLRTAVLGFATFSVLDRVDLLQALAPFPLLSRLLVVVLAQIHALRLVASESREGLTSRLPRRPLALDVLKNAGGITAALFALAARNAEEIGEAMRSRGF